MAEQDEYTPQKSGHGIRKAAGALRILTGRFQAPRTKRTPLGKHPLQLYSLGTPNA